MNLEGQYYALHHHPISALEESYDMVTNQINIKISKSIGREIYIDSKDADYNIPHTTNCWNLPCLSYKQAKDSFTLLQNRKTVWDKMRDNLKEDPSMNNLADLCADLRMKRPIVNLEMESFNLMIEKEQKAAQELKESRLNAKQALDDSNKQQLEEENMLKGCSQDVQRLFRELRRELNSAKSELNSAKAELNDEKEKCKSIEIELDGIKYIGLSRSTISSDQWHKRHPEACHQLFGFDTFDELKIYHKAFFPKEKNYIEPSSPSIQIAFFEKSLMWLMKTRVDMKNSQLVLIFERSKSSITRYLKAIGPLWKKIGLNLCLLDITESFLKEQMPQEFIDAHMTHVAALNDGKDFKSESVRVDSFFHRVGYSSKIQCNGFRIITYSLPYGLVLLTSSVYFARATEGGIVSIMGRGDVIEI